MVRYHYGWVIPLNLMLQINTIFPFYLRTTVNLNKMHMQCWMCVLIYFYSTTFYDERSKFYNMVPFQLYTLHIRYSSSYMLCVTLQKKYLQIPLIYKRKCVWIFIVMLHVLYVATKCLFVLKEHYDNICPSSLLDIQISVKLCSGEITFAV